MQVICTPKIYQNILEGDLLRLKKFSWSLTIQLAAYNLCLRFYMTHSVFESHIMCSVWWQCLLNQIHALQTITSFFLHQTTQGFVHGWGNVSRKHKISYGQVSSWKKYMSCYYPCECLYDVMLASVQVLFWLLQRIRWLIG